jgi:hypothetical protein
MLRSDPGCRRDKAVARARDAIGRILDADAASERGSGFIEAGPA